MADKTTTAAKPEKKTDTKADTKDKTSSEAGSGKESESAKSDAPKGYGRGENQKLVTDAYRNNWADIFGKKPRRKANK